ncbi:MAG: RNA methyltransferase [Haliscomenobacteraceae bacterium CHB4]|nr:RNA methyltransferase [Haliscomenobacteraceae bacterium CHB4]
MLPPPFEHQMQELLGREEYAAFLVALQETPPVSIRLNPFKTVDGGRWTVHGGGEIADEKISDESSVIHPPPSTVHRLPSTVPWHPLGFYLPERPVFTLDPAFHAGAYYVQEASSMFLYEALRQSVDFSRPLNALDLCAAPGGKSTLVADMLQPDSLLVANEVIRSRVGILRENLEKWGAPNIAVTSAEAEELAALEDFFDVVVTDAPCSGEGLFRKDPGAVREWSPANVELCSGRQRRILATAVKSLAPGGVLAYSTCTFNRAENEENVAWLTQNFNLEPVRLHIPSEWGIMETDGGYRFFPHKVRGEGFFLAVFRKKEGDRKKIASASAFKSIKPIAKNLAPEAARWLRPDLEVRFFQTPTGEVLALPATLETDYLILDKYLKAKWFGTMAGTFKGSDFIPSHALALSRLISPTLPALDLERDQALRFLKKETFDVPPDAPRGWTLARYAGLNLGWIKILPGRMNNYFPAERRIRMDIKSEEI